jgi:hypothetical protein
LAEVGEPVAIAGFMHSFQEQCLLTYIGNMAVIPNREPDVFGAISHPARRHMLDLPMNGSGMNPWRDSRNI